MIDWHSALSKKWTITSFRRFLAYFKNEVIRPEHEENLARFMVKGWEKLSILDVGCGRCEKEQHRLFRHANITCFDIHKPYLKICQNLGFPAICGDARRIERYFKPKSYDIIWLLDVIEHLTKAEGIKLLQKLAIIARRQILVFTPADFIAQDSFEGNPHYAHKSQWSTQDFTGFGFTCRVLKKWHRQIRLPVSKNGKVMMKTPDALWAIKTLPGGN